jgi:uncharacterized protein (DUF2267 family)
MTELSILAKNTQKAHEWLNEINNFLYWDKEEQNKALALLRATLHELRDNLPLNNLAHFSAQLPLIIRGVLFEGWNPNNFPLKERRKDDFIDGVTSHLPALYQDSINIETAVKAVFYTIATKVESHEVEKMKQVLSPAIRDLFPC